MVSASLIYLALLTTTSKATVSLKIDTLIPLCKVSGTSDRDYRLVDYRLQGRRGRSACPGAWKTKFQHSVQAQNVCVAEALQSLAK